MSRIPVYVWDVTLSVKKSTNDPLEIIDCLEKLAKKLTFQKEKGIGNNISSDENSEIEAKEKQVNIKPK